MPLFRNAFTTAPRLIGAACWVLLMSACARHPAPFNARAEPPAPPTISMDSLIVDVEEVRRIAGTSDLNSVGLLDVHQPYVDHSYDSKFPVQCQVVFDQDVAFGNDYAQFRSVEYAGAANVAVTQAVGAYADEGAGRAAFNRVASALTACSALHVPDLSFTVKKLDPSTVARCDDDQCSTFYRVKSAVLIAVDVVHFRDSGRIANTVLQTITDRINTA